MLQKVHAFWSRFKKPLVGSLVAVAAVTVTLVVVTAATWTDNSTASGTRTWTGIACSSDCASILAADSSSSSANLYRSTDAGVTWSAVTNGGSAFQKQWKHVASSSNGTILLASELTGDLWFSTDSGANWTDVSSVGSGSWTGVDMSADGTVMVAISNGGGKVGFWKSINTGSTWTNPSRLGALTPNAIACSSDCSKIIVGMFGNNIYRSTDTGANWSALSNSASGFYTGVASSGDGTKLASVLSFGGALATSSNSGANWTDQTNAGTGGGGLWQSVAISDDGTKLLAVSTTNVKTSTDSGVNWSTESGPGTATWRKAVMSNDGAYMVIGGTTTGIWTSGTLPVTAPGVTTQAASSVTTISVTLNGTITSIGNENPHTRGFEYGTTAGYGSTTVATGSFTATAFSVSVSGLTCNTGYHFRAYAINSGGTGVGSDTTFTTSACPVAPTTTTGTATSFTYGSATLAGNITATGGENPSSRYAEYGTTVSYGMQSATESGSFSTGTFTARAVGLAAGTTYHYRLCSVNTAGTGCGSDSTFTTLAAPGQPTSLSATAGYAQASLSWSAPGSSGDYSITDYIVEYKLSADSTWTVFPDGTSTSTSAIVTGLTNGSAYNFRVSARSYAGAGTASSTASATPSSTPTEPNVPSGLAGTGSSGAVTLTWTVPNNTGGSAITDYAVQYKTLTATSYTTYSDGVSTTAGATVSGLTNGTGYNFRVAAINAVGTGSYSSAITVGAGSAIYRHILGTGQSLAEGVNSAPALSTTQPYSNKSLSTTPISGLSAPLIPLVEGVVARESPASGRANSLAAAMAGNPTIIDTIHALGGIAYAGIKKGGSAASYANGQTQASVSKTQTEAAGAYYLPFAVTIVHGETDQINGTSASTYTAAMSELQGDYESDWNALTGRSDSIPLFESQMNSNSVGYIAVAQLDAHRNYPGDVILIGPKYQYAYGAADHLHLTNTSSKLLGEMFGKVMKKVLVDGETWDPLMPVSVTRSGTTVLIDVHIPTGTLAIDTTNVTAHEDYGFEFVQTGGSAISITGVSLTDSNRKIALTLSGVPDGSDPHIRYAWSCSNHPNDNTYSQCGDPTDHGAIGGNIRDTDTSTSPSSAGTGTALYDWLVTFDEPITDTTHPEAPTGLTATPSTSQVALTWTVPEVDGGASITDYVIEYKTAAASSWSTFADGTSTATSATVTSLTNGTLYQFRVSGLNSIGQGDPSATVYSTPSGVPTAPTSLSATGGNTQATLTWTAPSDNGGSDVTDYVIEYKISTDGSWSTFSDGTSATTSAVVTGLTNNTTYNFRVYAVNESGTSSASSTANATTAGVPDAPASLTATPGNLQMGLGWTAPAANGSAITDYVIEYKLASDGSWSTFSDGTSTATSATVTGLTNGSSYNFRVYAVNGIGTSSASSTATDTPATTPDAPTSLAATRGNAQVSLVWVAPASNGGAAVSDYVIEYKLSTDGSWSTFADGTSTATSATVTSLTNGSLYNFRVSATNTAGTGSASSTANATPATTPDAPTSLTATPGNLQMGLSWTAPASNGGDALTDYLVEYKLATDGSWSTFADGTSTTASTTVTGLTNGSSYNFRVSAINTVGTGTASGTATATPATTPGIPTSLAATRGNAQVSLVWVAPASNGGAAVSDYVIEYKLSADSSWSTFADGTSTATSATVTSLTNGSAYDFRVSASNTAGTGSVSSTASATPATTPGAPTSLAATARNTEVNLVWVAPSSTGGDALTDYVIEYKLASDGSWSTFSDGTSTATAVTVTGLTNDESYNFRVSASNTVGTGSASSTATATPTSPVTPNVPTGLTATAGSGQASLSWTAPANNGGSAITDYLVEYKLSAAGTWSTFVDDVSALTSAIVTSLTGGSSYMFRVSAINAIGTGSPSDTATATPTSAASSGGTNRRGVPVAFVSRPPAVVPKDTPRTGTGSGMYVSPIDASLKSCPAMTKDIRFNSKANSVAEVKLWQAFLNKELSLNIPLTGFYGPATLAGTKTFQEKYRAVILDPQGIKNPTGTVAGGTRGKANAILGCTI